MSKELPTAVKAEPLPAMPKERLSLVGDGRKEPSQKLLTSDCGTKLGAQAEPLQAMPKERLSLVRDGRREPSQKLVTSDCGTKLAAQAEPLSAMPKERLSLVRDGGKEPSQKLVTSDCGTKLAVQEPGKAGMAAFPQKVAVPKSVVERIMAFLVSAHDIAASSMAPAHCAAAVAGCMVDSRSADEHAACQNAASIATTDALSEGDAVWVWSASARRWLGDGKVKHVDSDGSVTVRYNSAHPCEKIVPARAVHKFLKRRGDRRRQCSPPSDPGAATAKCSSGDAMDVDDGPLERARAPQAGIFVGCVVLVSHLGGAWMSSARRRLLRARVEEAGGVAPETWGSEVTHLVVVPHLSRASLHTTYRGAHRGPSFKAVVIDSWLCDSLANGRCLPEHGYIWRCPVAAAAKAEKEAAAASVVAAKEAEAAGGAASAECNPRSASPRTPLRHPGKRGRGEDEGDRGDGIAAKRRKPGATSGGFNFPHREGDWYCPKCGGHNFRKRDKCWKRECDGVKLEVEEDAPSVAENKSRLAAAPPTPAPDELRDLIVEEFRICGEGFAARGDNWRSWQYKKAEKLVMAARNCSTSELEQLGLTTKFVDKCEEIRLRGFLQQAATFRKDPDLQVLLELTRVHGVGAKLAQSWLKYGVRSLDDVRARADSLPSSASGAATGLSRVQSLGLQFVEDFEIPIPRDEVERIAALVRQHAATLGIVGPVVPCGGYRSGDARCSGVHLVVAVGDREVAAEGDRLLACLHERGVIVADLSRGSGSTVPKVVPMSSYSSVHPTPPGAPPGMQVSMCVAQGSPAHAGEPARFRRCDLVMCASSALPFVTLQWTGSDNGLYNRELKRLAAFHGFHLSNTYLCRADREFVRGRNVGEIARCGISIECADEEAIYAAMGIPYKRPEDRQVDTEMLAMVAEAAKLAPSFRQVAKAELEADSSAHATPR